MFDIAWSEFLVVAVVALVVVGPKDLPALLRTVGKTVATLRRMAGEFQTQFNDAMREADLDDLRKEVTGLKDKASAMVSAPNPLQMARDEIRGALDAKPAPSALAGSAAEPAADAPSALAPLPQIAPVDEPPPVGDADFAHRLPEPEAPSAPPPPPQAEPDSEPVSGPDAAHQEEGEPKRSAAPGAAA